MTAGDTTPNVHDLTPADMARLDAFLADGGYVDVDAWALDSDYLLTSCCGWVDLDDNPVNIVECAFHAMAESENTSEPDLRPDPGGCRGALVALVVSVVVFWGPIIYLVVR